MELTVKAISINKTEEWDRYADNNNQATVYHLSGWPRVIEKTYGHKAYLLAASRKCENSIPGKERFNEIIGILPMVKIRNVKFFTSLISTPFCDYGGAVADGVEIQHRLVLEAILLGKKIGAKQVELRNTEKFASNGSLDISQLKSKIFYNDESRRFRMLLKLPGTSSELMGSFKSKLRSQIRRPLKTGCTVKIGKSELIEDFYTVFLSNMRDLGSPVHSKSLFVNIFREMGNRTNIFIVYNNSKPVAGSITIGFRDTLYNPWASSLRKYAKFSPNMLLYWKMLEFASDNSFRMFDFGRSSKDEGTYKFKKQWGAAPVPLPWKYISYEQKGPVKNISESITFQVASKIWKRIPVGFTKVIGPHFRKHIGL